MRKIKNKIMAGFFAVVMTATVAGTIPASAIKLSDSPNSAFEYEVYTMVENNQIKVRFQVTNNPGFNCLGVAVKYDEECTPHSEKTVSSKGDGISNQSNNTHLSIFQSVSLADIKGNYYIDFYFDAPSLTSECYSFSVGVFQYQSSAEPNCTLSNGGAETVNHVHDISYETQGVCYTLGDIDNDGAIEIQDANDILKIVQKNGASMSTSVLNARLARNTYGWKTAFPELPCAEAADVDFDNMITQADAQKVLTYNSQMSVGQTFESLIGKQYIKTVTV